jgi:retron-type reverse transcriptase
VAQTAAAMLLEEILEPVFHRDSYGYRPERSAHDALAMTISSEPRDVSAWANVIVRTDIRFSWASS